LVRNQAREPAMQINVSAYPGMIADQKIHRFGWQH
jgi:hypothetical protein